MDQAFLTTPPIAAPRMGGADFEAGCLALRTSLFDRFCFSAISSFAITGRHSALEIRI